jgi:TRAP-type C4-dicarboxylate transport system permease small subunit
MPERPSGGNNGSMMKEKRAQPISRIIVDVFAFASFSILVAMMLWMTIDTVLHPFGKQIYATYTWIEILNIIAVSLGLVYVTFRKAHIAIELLNHYLGKRVMRWITIFSTVLFLAFLVLLSWQWAMQAWRSVSIMEFQQETIKIYYFPGKVALAIGFIGSAIAVLLQLINEFTGRRLD